MKEDIILKTVESLLVKSEKVLIIGTAITAIAILVAERFLPAPGMFRDDIPSITLFLLSVFVLSFFARERMITELAKWRNLGLQAVYHNRSDPGQFSAYIDLLNGAESDLFVVGITLRDIRAQMPILIEKGKRACSVEFLMMNPRYWRNSDPILDPVAAAAGDTLKADFQLAISQIRILAMSMAGAQAKIEVRFYHQAPTLSLTAVDAAGVTGKMRIEMIPHNSTRHGYFRPMFDLQRAGEKDLFSQFHRHYRALWEDSLAYLRVHDSKVWVNSALDQELSGLLDLPTDWLPQDLSAPGDTVNLIEPSLILNEGG